MRFTAIPRFHYINIEDSGYFHKENTLSCFPGRLYLNGGCVMRWLKFNHCQPQPENTAIS